MDRVFLIWEHYDNGEEYDDYYFDNKVIAICPSKQRAEQYIASLSLPTSEHNEEPWKEVPCDDDDIIRAFRKRHYYDDGNYEYTYDIQEMEVTK